MCHCVWLIIISLSDICNSCICVQNECNQSWTFCGKQHIFLLIWPTTGLFYHLADCLFVLNTKQKLSFVVFFQSAAAAPSPVMGNMPPNDGMPGGPMPPGFFQVRKKKSPLSDLIPHPPPPLTSHNPNLLSAPP